jgi:lysophospholipase L1-like esterase
MRLVALGDSITAPSGGQFGNPCGRSWTTFLTLPLADFHNAGVAGNTTAQMLARLSPDVLAYHPTDVTILGGVNDLYQDYTYHDVPLQDSLANLGSTIGQIEAAGATAWLLTIPPWWAGHAAPVEAYNAALRGLAAAHGARLIDIWPLLAGPGGDWIPGYSCDDSHPTNAGAAIIAGAVQVRLSRGS